MIEWPNKAMASILPPGEYYNAAEQHSSTGSDIDLSICTSEVYGDAQVL